MMHKHKSKDERGGQKWVTMGRNKNKKYSLDSDEEDEADHENLLHESNIEGEEEGISKNIGEECFTPFNMQEELEEGHFDRDGHFIWKNQIKICDNWLDNIEWQKIKSAGESSAEKELEVESNDSETEPFQKTSVYKQILTYMQSGETINKTLRRLGAKYKNLSSIEKLRRRKAGLLDSNLEVTELTELANKILSETGNMDVYQETYEDILNKVDYYEKKSKLANSAKEATLDMYADDFDVKEKDQINKAAAKNW